MNDLPKDEGLNFCQNWWQIVTSLLGCQCKSFLYPYHVSLKFMEGVLCRPAGTETSSEEQGETRSRTGEEIRRLERQAVERVGQGHAPPKEIYETPYRDRIDWSRFPVWARPSDPELFQGCVHEG